MLHHFTKFYKIDIPVGVADIINRIKFDGDLSRGYKVTESQINVALLHRNGLSPAYNTVALPCHCDLQQDC